MKFEIIEGCTDETLRLNDIEIQPSEHNKDIFIGSINKILVSLSSEQLYSLLNEAITSHPLTQWESLGYCETCGDTPQKCLLELKE